MAFSLSMLTLPSVFLFSRLNLWCSYSSDPTYTFFNIYFSIDGISLAQTKTKDVDSFHLAFQRTGLRVLCFPLFSSSVKSSASSASTIMQTASKSQLLMPSLEFHGPDSRYLPNVPLPLPPPWAGPLKPRLHIHNSKLILFPPSLLSPTDFPTVQANHFQYYFSKTRLSTWSVSISSGLLCSLTVAWIIYSSSFWVRTIWFNTQLSLSRIENLLQIVKSFFLPRYCASKFRDVLAHSSPHAAFLFFFFF